MSDFVKRKRGEKLLAIFEAAVTSHGQLEDKNPLYKCVPDKRGQNFYELKSSGEVKDPVRKLFKLLQKHNGYGERENFSFANTIKDVKKSVAKSRTDSEEFNGTMRRALNDGGVAIRSMDAKTLGHLVFTFNRERDAQNRNIAEKISDGTFVAILERALELGHR